ncbi:MAG TPA: hypothetical protein DCE80_19100 [Ignavibacteriales bacterium]|nr:hypothetical protein [Ignavibacteriales bacterium]
MIDYGDEWRGGLFVIFRKQKYYAENGWNDSMQTLFLNIAIKNEKRNNWNTYTCPPLVDATPCSNVFFNKTICAA